MKYVGNIITGECCSAGNYNKIIDATRFPREWSLIEGTVVEITGYQKGEYKYILRKKNFETGTYDFLAKTTRQWREVKDLKEKDGWEIRKEASFKTTYDEYPVFGKVQNEE